MSMTTKTAGTGYTILMHLLGEKHLGDVMERLDDDEQSMDLLSQSVRLLGKKFDISSQEEAAFNRLSNMVRDGKSWPADLLRNNVFKIANLLKIKLPSGMFASQANIGSKTAMKTATAEAWLPVFQKLDTVFPSFNTKTVTDWNKVHNLLRGPLKSRDAGAVAHWYSEYRAGRFSQEAAIQALVQEKVLPPVVKQGSKNSVDGARLAELRRRRGRVEYQQTITDKVLATKATRVLHDLTTLLPKGRIHDVPSGFDAYFFDAGGEPLKTSWLGEVRGEAGEELTLSIERDIPANTFEVKIHATFIRDSGGYKAINTILDKAPFGTAVSEGQAERLLSQVVPRVQDGLAAAGSTAAALKAQYALLTEGTVKFKAALGGLVSKFGWGVEFEGTSMLSHSERDGVPILYGSVGITGVVTPEVGAMKNPEQRRALSPLVAKARTLVQKAAASARGVQVLVSKKPGRFSQNVLYFTVEVHLPTGSAVHLGGFQQTSTQGDIMSDLHQAIQRIAAQHPETRQHLVPLIRKYACTCGTVLANGDELMGGRTWGNPDPHSKPDDNAPYNKHEDSPPAGADGSPQRKKYNEWFRSNVCPKHKTNCGAPWLTK